MHEKTLQTKTVYDGRIVHLEVLEVELPNGTRSVREVIRHSGAAVVLPRRADGKFLFVRQFRKPVEQVLLEVPAGTREDHEDAELCARREVEEETGYRAEALFHLGTVYPSPGYVDERMEFFFAPVTAHSDSLELDEDEQLEPVALDEDDVCGRIARAEILDAKTLAIWLMYEKRRHEIEASLTGARA